jgi:tetratricopeptide (TPR) repeat protein
MKMGLEGGRKWRWSGLLAASVILASGLMLAPMSIWAQDPATDHSNPPQGAPPSGTPAESGQEPAGAAPPPPAAAPSGSKKSGGKVKNPDGATQSAPDQPVWDPLRAEKDLEVGRHYMSMGDVDAAIDRFEDAAAAKPGFAIPYLYLGEAQEKKGQKRLAIKSYTRYLDLLPHAEDAAKVRKKIDKLYKDLEKDKK